MMPSITYVLMMEFYQSKLILKSLTNIITNIIKSYFTFNEIRIINFYEIFFL